MVLLVTKGSIKNFPGFAHFQQQCRCSAVGYGGWEFSEVETIFHSYYVLIDIAFKHDSDPYCCCWPSLQLIKVLDYSILNFELTHIAVRLLIHFTLNQITAHIALYQVVNQHCNRQQILARKWRTCPGEGDYISAVVMVTFLVPDSVPCTTISPRTFMIFPARECRHYRLCNLPRLHWWSGLIVEGDDDGNKLDCRVTIANRQGSHVLEVQTLDPPWNL